MRKKRAYINHLLRLEAFIGRHLFTCIAVIQVSLVNSFAQSDQYLALTLSCVLFAIISLYMSMSCRTSKHQVLDNLSTADRIRHSRQFYLLVGLFLLMALSTFNHLYRPYQWSQECMQNQQHEQERLVVLSSEETAWGSTSVVARVGKRQKIQVRLPGATTYQYGDQISLSLDYSSWQPADNPGAFDEQSYYRSQGILLQAKPARDSIVEVHTQVYWYDRPQRLANRLNNAISDYYLERFGDKSGALAAAMFLGQTKDLSKNIKEDFKLAGLSHLLVVSGSNVSLVFTFLMPLLERSGARWRYRQFLLLPALLFFGFLIAWDASVTRAIAMNFILIIARLMKRPIHPGTALAVGVNLIAVLNPRSALQIGFLMSAVVSFALIELVEKLCDRSIERFTNRFKLRRRWLLSSYTNQTRIKNLIIAVITPMVSQFAVMPFAMKMSSSYTAIAVPINWVAVPLAACLTVLLTLVSPLTFIGRIVPTAILKLIVRPIQTLLLMMLKLAEIPRVYQLKAWRLSSNVAYFYLILIVLLVAFIYAWEREVFITVLLLAILGCSCTAAIRYWRSPEMSIYFLSVGQGDAALIKMKNGQTILIDTGTESKGNEVIPPALEALGIKAIDLAVITHLDQDHCGALASLMEKGLIRQVGSPFATIRIGKDFDEERAYQAQLEDCAAKWGIKWIHLSAGDSIRPSERTQLSCIYPSAEHLKGGNASSLVFYLESDRLEILFTADLELAGENELINARVLSDVDVIKVAHHGSKTSSSPAFLKAIQAEIAFISVGKNLYGHPHPAVLQSLEETSRLIFRSDHQGALVVESRRDRWTVFRYNDPKRRWEGD